MNRMTFEDFKTKWMNRPLYVPAGDSMHICGGMIQDSLRTEYFDGIYTFPAIVIYTPTWHGWANDKQRREFYKDAKAAGFRACKKEKMTWYKRIYK